MCDGETETEISKKISMYNTMDQNKVPLVNNPFFRIDETTSLELFCLPEAGDIVTQPMKSVSFVPKTITPTGSSWIPLTAYHAFGRLARLEAMHFHLIFHLFYIR